MYLCIYIYIFIRTDRDEVLSRWWEFTFVSKYRRRSDDERERGDPEGDEKFIVNRLSPRDVHILSCFQMATGCGLLAVLVLLLLVDRTYSEVAFESLCSSEVEVAGLSSIDGDDEFEIDLYESKFLPDDTILRRWS